jgi:hypothetical protein
MGIAAVERGDAQAAPLAQPASDPFIDDLFVRLRNELQTTLAKAASATRSRERVASAARAWWDEFCEVLERKVRAWNGKDEPEARVTCTRSAFDSILLWHHAVEAQLTLQEARVVVTGRVGDTQPRQSPFIEFNETRGSVAAILAGERAPKSPSAAADHLLAPLLTRAFAG